MRAPRTAFGSPRRTCGCAAPASCWARARAACRRFRFADLAAHADLLAPARDDARLIVAPRPAADGPRGRALRCLLRLFERDAAARYLDSG